jgi:hypothetical protein
VQLLAGLLKPKPGAAGAAPVSLAEVVVAVRAAHTAHATALASLV